MFEEVKRLFKVDEWKQFADQNKETNVFDHLAVSSGISDNDFTKVLFSFLLFIQ